MSEIHQILAITHGPKCMDGAGSSWVIHNHFKSMKNYNIIHFRVDPGKAFNTIYTKFKDLEPDFFTEVISCDVGYSGKDMHSLIAMFPNIIIIDHHISSFRDINTFYNNNIPINYIFDNEESGASLAWKYFNGDLPAPKTIQYIKDRDLWKFELPDSKEIAAGLFEMLPTDPTDNWKTWDDFIDREDINLPNALNIGKVISCLNLRRIIELSSKFKKFNFEFGGKTYKGAHLNTAEHISELGNYVVNMKDINGQFIYDFALMWRYNEPDDTYNCSLRSRNGVDVSSFCRKYGGGGHETAAGLSINNIFEIINPNKFVHEMNNYTLNKMNIMIHETNNRINKLTNIVGASCIISGLLTLSWILYH